MSKRIGELLVQKGVLTEEQLDVGLNAQLVFGGHLGTCLVEQGLVSEDQLGEALAESYGVGYAGAKSLDSVPGPLIECFPLKLAEKYAMVPFRLENGTIHVAMINPRQVEALAAAACSTGFRIKAWVAPEIRIYQALERYYHVPRRLRFVALCRELDRSTSSKPLQKQEARSSPDRWPSVENDPVYDIGSDSDPRSEPEHRDLQSLGAEFGYGRSWQEIAEGADPPNPRTASVPDRRNAPPPKATGGVSLSTPLDAPGPGPAPEPATRAVTSTEPSAVPVRGPRSTPQAPVPVAAVISLEQATDQLVSANTPEQVASAFLDWAVAGTPRCLLWRVDRVTAVLWDWRGFAVSPAVRERLTLGVTEEPLFRLVAGSNCYRGPVPDNPAYHGFFDRLGTGPAAEIELVPLHMDDRLVALFYGDSGKQPAITRPSREYRRALLKLGYALWMLRLKQKIRAT
jgi:hypothetical protein